MVSSARNFPFFFLHWHVCTRAVLFCFAISSDISEQIKHLLTEFQSTDTASQHDVIMINTTLTLRLGEYF